MNLKNLFGQNLKTIRKERNLTQEQLAEIIEVETGFVGMIETGKRAPSFETLQKITEKLDVSYSDLFDLKDNSTPNTLQKLILKEIKNEDAKTLNYILKSVKELKKYKNEIQ